MDQYLTNILAFDPSQSKMTKTQKKEVAHDGFISASWSAAAVGEEVALHYSALFIVRKSLSLSPVSV